MFFDYSCPRFSVYLTTHHHFDWCVRLNQGNGQGVHSSPHEVVIAINSGTSWAIWRKFALLVVFFGTRTRGISSYISSPCEITLWHFEFQWILCDQAIQHRIFCSVLPRGLETPQETPKPEAAGEIYGRPIDGLTGELLGFYRNGLVHCICEYMIIS